MSNLKQTVEITNYLSRNKTTFNNLPASKACELIEQLYDVKLTGYRMRKMLVAAGCSVRTHKHAPSTPPAKETNDTLKSLSVMLERVEAKVDFLCDQAHYKKTGERPQ